MSLSLLIDEDSQSKRLVGLLTSAGHNVVTVNDLEMSGASDEQVLEAAQTDKRVVITRNCKDFEAIHAQNSDHSGILLVHQGSEKAKNMTRQAIIRAIQNLETAGVALSGQCIRLNQWMY